jgi:NADH-quinone oxidoreductase subunit H
MSEIPFGLTSAQLAQLAAGALVIGAMLHVILGGCAYAIMLERKLSAWMQDRVGPNRVGPKGLLQPIADGLKFILKEDYAPRGVDVILFTLAPGLLMVPAMMGFLIIPWGGTLDLGTLPFVGDRLAGLSVNIIGADINVGVVYLLAAGALGVYGVALGAWASNNKWSFLGGLRASAQMISYEIPMGLCLLAVILTAGSMLPTEIVAHQAKHGWNLLAQPIVAILFFTCLLAESNRLPFDLAEAESELVGGYHTEYSAMRFAMFFLAEYFHMITGSAFFAVLFLGGWSINPLPFGWQLPAEGSILLILLQVGVMLGKAFLMLSLMMAIRWTIPRFRFDQLMKLAWEGMIPTSLLVVLMTSVFVHMGWTSWLWAGSLGCVAIVYAIQPFMPRQANANRRIPMVGSRWYPAGERGRAAPSHPVALSDAAIPDPRQGPVSMH